MIDGWGSWTRSIGESSLTPLAVELNPPPDIRHSIHGFYADKRIGYTKDKMVANAAI
ncbi:uncharacterized protein An01g04010 [Aspergillus niger]|uniref:Contig An01c0120, genomic contig n=2 Tax=Aspergillus niger TaxID=5061 RepID=A2Q8E0_ASPNC|nr:uncharacterized protein An01g04010 [Aspergillus niger]CAK36937.1 unnamed protein product [Aspergillus niger]